ncbi:MAG: DUF4184 family protein [Acidobacteria bacterium]|nr:DUF4184 family protein [Acidobacteriota bacterium]
MPFTLSHAAAVLPVAKKIENYLPLSALLMGSFSPDFRYFFPDIQTRTFSHSIEGLFLFCLPLGLLALLVFHYLVKESVVQLLPERVLQRLEARTLQFAFLPPRRLGWICLAILVGAFTHIVWDSFTHEHGWSVERWAILRQTVLRFSTHEVRLYKILQHLSSLIGLGVVGYWSMQWVQNQPPRKAAVKGFLSGAEKRRIILSLISLSLFYALLLGLYTSTYFRGFRAIQEFTVQIVVGFMTGMTMLVLLYSLYFKALTANLFKTTVEDEGLD